MFFATGTQFNIPAQSVLVLNILRCVGTHCPECWGANKMNRVPRLSIVILTLLLITAMILLSACGGETITIERSTPEPEATRGLSAPATARPPIPTPELGERVDFPPMSDGAALTALYDATGGDGWSDNSEWLYNDDLGQWHGVTTDAAGRVTALDLSSNGLSGELTEELEYLTELTELNLSGNALSGALPAEMGSLVKLEELYLDGNQFSGALPAALSALTALTDLHLHGNQFGAEFPPALAGLTELDSVTIWNNRFTWADSYAPGLLADMIGLVALYESAGGDRWSQRSGWLSDPSVASWSGVSIGGEGLITGLDLSENGLSGELPPALGSVASLTALNLSGNQLEGEIPSTIGNLTGLEDLYLNDNQLDGSLPADMGNLTALTHLSLHTNQLTGNIPAGIGGMAELEELHLHSNRFGGPVPAELGNLGNLEALWLHDNQLSGELPTELASLPNLERVSLFGNRFDWADSYTPGTLADMVGLLALYESTDGENWANKSKWLTLAPVGEWHGVTVGAGGLVAELNLRENHLNGELPSQVGNLASLTVLDLFINELDGEIPNSLGALSNLEILYLSSNSLRGTIPVELGNLAKLRELGLRENQLSGSIPAELGNLSNLERLWLNENQLSGRVPAELGRLSNLTRLHIENNNLDGVLPSELGDLSQLRHVSIWGNDLRGADHYENGLLADMVALVALYDSANGEEWEFCSGTCSPGSAAWHTATGTASGFGGRRPGYWLTYKPLGEWVGVSTSGEGGRVVELNLNSPKWRNVAGKLPPALGLLTGLEKLTINEHGLTGEIPPELGELPNLEHLGLWKNHLTGTIPPQLGNLAELEELWLNENQLSGAVPAQLGQLSNLTTLRIENNNLEGVLPSELGNLSQLRYVSTWGNELRGADHYENGLLADMVALVALYDSANGEEWEFCSGICSPSSAAWHTATGTASGFGGRRPGYWLTYKPLGEWVGVSTSGEGGRVVELNLNSPKWRNVAGKLPPALGLLTGLEKLNLENKPDLSGCIPSSLRRVDYTGDLPFCP